MAISTTSATIRPRVSYRRDRQLVLALPKQFVAKRDEFVIGQLAPEDLAFVARGCCRPLSARRDGRDLSYPFDHSNLLRMEARSTKSFSAVMCACSDSNGSLSAPRMARSRAWDDKSVPLLINCDLPASARHGKIGRPTEDGRSQRRIGMAISSSRPTRVSA
jgi:hypothetical protein